MKTLAIAAAAFGLAASAVPALAQTPETTSVEVSLADIDLATPEGQRQADARLERAVRVACRVTDPMTGSRIVSQDAGACIAKARASAGGERALITENQRRGG